MNYKLLSSCLTILLTSFFIAKNSLSFNPIRFHCPNYMLNSYLYLILSMSILISTIFTLEHIKVDLNKLFAGNTRFLLLILSFILIIGVTIISPNYFLTKHILWLLFIAVSGIFLYPLLVENKLAFYHTASTTFLLIAVLTLVTFIKPDMIKDSYFMPLFIGLITLLISRISSNLLSNWGFIDNNKFGKIYSYITIILFSLFTMYDTKEIIKNAENCINPDYINQSLNLFLNSLNIFTSSYDINN